jgi:hypothetical protein
MEKPYFQIIPVAVKEGLENSLSPEELEAFLKNTPYGRRLLSDLELLASDLGEKKVQEIIEDVQSLGKWGYGFLHKTAALNRIVEQVIGGDAYLDTLQKASELLGDGYLNSLEETSSPTSSLNQKNLKENLRTLRERLDVLADKYNVRVDVLPKLHISEDTALSKPPSYKARGVMNS